MEQLDTPAATPVAQTGIRKLLRKPSEFLYTLQKNDDETERNMRRSKAENLRRISQIPSGSSDNPVINMKHLNKQQVFDTLNKWQKMYAENKITKHNVWSLHVVEYMRRYLGMQSDADSMHMLKFASSALEVSSKVYGLRVDCVYDNSMKLASRINRIYAQGHVDAASDTEDSRSNAGEDQCETYVKQKKIPKRRIAKCTIAKDVSELYGSFPLMVSSMFNVETHIMNSKTENLLSNRLLFSKSGTMMKIWNEECVFRRESDVDPLVSEPLVHKSFPIQLLPITFPPICSQLRNFILDEWDSEQDILYQHLEETMYDKDGYPVPEMDVALNHANTDDAAIYINSDDEDLNCETLVQEMERNIEVAFVVDFNPNNSNLLQVNEYSYRNNDRNINSQLSQIWAGPSHWKLKSLKHRVARYTGSQNNKQECNKPSKRTRKEVESISFEDCDPILSKIVPLKKNRTKPWVEKSKLFMPLLKADLLMLDAQLAKFESVIKKFKNKENTEKTKFKIENNFEHLNEVDNAGVDFDECANNMFNTSQSSITDAESINPSVGSCSNFLSNNLVEKPDTIRKSCITYQTRAKKINMMKLKAVIWECITNTNKNAKAPSEMAGTIRFKDLLKKLPAKLSNEAAAELTSHTVFVALLHLANEHCLALENNGDIIIRQD